MTARRRTRERFALLGHDRRGRSHVGRPVERSRGIFGAAQGGESPGPAELRGRKPRPTGKHLFVGIERRAGVAPHDGHRREPEKILRSPRIGGRSCSVRCFGGVEIALMKTDEPERMPRFRIVRAAPNGFLESRTRLFYLPPPCAPHSAFAWPVGRRRDRPGGFVVRLQGIVVAMRQFQSMSELEVRGRVGRTEASRQLFGLGTSRGNVAGKAQHANEQSTGGHILGVVEQPPAQYGQGFGLSVLADQGLRS
jgi:hypothetical protein